MTTYSFKAVTIPGANAGVIAAGIDDLGRISGSYTQGFPDNPYPQAFILNDAGGFVSLGAGPGGHHSSGYHMNNKGDLALQSGRFAQTSRGFVYHSGTATFDRLTVGTDPLRPYTTAIGANDLGYTVGAINFGGASAGFFADGSQGAIWHNGFIVGIFSMPGADWTVATDVTDYGITVGTYDTNGTHHGFIGYGGQQWTLDVPHAVSTNVWSINEKSEITGSFTDANGATHGFVDLAGHFSEIDMPGATNTFIYDANDYGQIVGAYTMPNDPVPHSFVATPDFDAMLPAAPSLPFMVRHQTGLAHGSLYDDPTQAVLATVRDSALT